MRKTKRQKVAQLFKRKTTVVQLVLTHVVKHEFDDNIVHIVCKLQENLH